MKKNHHIPIFVHNINCNIINSVVILFTVIRHIVQIKNTKMAVIIINWQKVAIA